MKKYLFIAVFAILAVSVNAQSTSGKLLKRDTSYTPPTLVAPMIISDSNYALYMWRSAATNKWYPIPVSTSATKKVYTSDTLTVADKLKVTTGSNKSMGTATLSSGTVTVSNTAVTASSVIFISVNTPGGTQGTAYVSPSGSIVAGTSFIIKAVNTSGTTVTTDTSTVNWWIIN